LDEEAISVMTEVEDDDLGATSTGIKKNKVRKKNLEKKVHAEGRVDPKVVALLKGY
jgi:hypothetical protein